MGEERTQQHTLLFRINTTHEDLISQGGIHIPCLCKFKTSTFNNDYKMLKNPQKYLSYFK